jgi:hypothetical protein
MGREATQAARRNKSFLSKAGIYSLPDPEPVKMA